MKSLAGAGTLLVALVVSGCTGDPEPQFAPEPSPSPSAPATSAEPEPEAWEEKSPEGAVAFAKHWTATFSEAFQTGDLGDFRKLNDKDCESCSFLVETVESIYEGGGTATGDQWQLREAATSSPNDDGNSLVVTGVMRIPPLTIERPGQPAEEEPATSARFNFYLTWEDRWVTERLVRQT